MTAPKTDFEAPVASDELRVTGPIDEMTAPPLKVSPSPRPETTFTIAPSVPSVASNVKMNGIPLAINCTAEYVVVMFRPPFLQ